MTTPATTTSSVGSVSQAVAWQEASAAGLIDQYPVEFTAMLPSHLNAESWLRSAKAALKKGRIVDGRYEIEAAAASDPGSFFQALREAALLGLRPGTKEYYLTPRREKGRLRVLGIIGYQGMVELIYRGGAVSAVIVEAVYTGDRFSFAPGRDEVPVHEIDWDADDRGELRLAYAYARMKGGGYSKVVVLNRARIERIKAASKGAEADTSPWRTDPEAMWLKSAARQLEKWVPTSAEYREAIIRDAIAVHTATTRPTATNAVAAAQPAVGAGSAGDAGEVVEAELLPNGEEATP